MSTQPIAPRQTRQITIEIDHKPVACPEGATVLRAAELNGAYIPSLCSHKDLTPFGGCRLCMVEIEGMRGYPLACSTVVQEGMKVLSESAALREMRREICELILSEHPSSCLICPEGDACRENQYTIRKAGVSTGCRTCPKDGDCELQRVVEKLGITDIHYPVYYRGYEAERDDPFFDRDYNICILCGRCVRMCQEVRGASVLAFKHRGSKTLIGPAFARNHVEAGCEFCGACVSVCPTGTLADKVSKWDGKADGFEVSTCPFCALGCRIELHHKDGRLSRVHGHLDPEINDGQLCVRGRFCLPETTHHHERARKPVLKRGPYFREVDWAEALADVAERLRGLAPEDLLVVVSPDLTNESLYAAQRFVRVVMGSNSIDSSARAALPGGLEDWSQLFSLPVSLASVAHAEVILAVGCDTRFSFSVAGVEIRRALKEGATLVTIDSRDSNLARYTDHWLRPQPGREGPLLRLFAERLLGTGDADAARSAAGKETALAAAQAGVDPAALERALAAVAAGSGQGLAVIVGPAAFALDVDREIAQTILRLARRPQTTILPLYHGANTRGALELGALGEILPGLRPAEGSGISLADVLGGRARPKVLYLVGETPFFERPPCDYIIAQDLYRPPFEVDAFLPAASFAEAEGTLTNVEGRVQELVRIEELPDGALTGCARPDWLIFTMLAEALGSPELPYRSAAEVRAAIHAEVPDLPAEADRQPRRLRSGAPVGRDAASLRDRETAPARPGAADSARSSAASPSRTPAATSPPSPDGSLRLVLEPGAFRHRGIDLSAVVQGLAELRLEEGLRLHPDDLEEIGAKDGDRVSLRLNGCTISEVARADPDCPRHTVVLHRPATFGGVTHRRELEPLFRSPSAIADIVAIERRDPAAET